MLVYVAHEYGGDIENVKKARKITKALQRKYPHHTFITPLLAFSHLTYNELGYDVEMRMCSDLLAMCDKLIIASSISKGVGIEIGVAEEMGIDIEYLGGAHG